MKKIILIVLLIPCGAFANYFYNGTVIKSVTLQDNGTLEVVEVTPSPFMYPEGGSPPGDAVKYIYAAKDGKIFLKEKIKGSYYPESFETKPESIEFDH
jgi:hypothetical protein